MLLDGSVDAVMTARPPAGLGQGIERLMPDYQALELAYFKATRVYPIMHALVIKTAVLDAHPWVAMNVYKAFMQAKTQSMARLSDITASHAPLPWLADYTDRLEAVFGADFYPYGIGQDAGGQINRATLEAFCKFGHDQGVCDRLLNVEELFAKNVLGSFKV
jgi:4,5-dihydroxyphthalate decarboxylase